MVRTGWFLLKWGLLLAIVGVAIGVPYFYRQVDERIRCHVEELFAAQYSDLKVSVRSAEVVDGEGIVVRGMLITEPAAEGTLAELARFEEIVLYCKTDLKELVGGSPAIGRIVIRRPTLRVTRHPDGTWGTARLFPLPKLSDNPPVLTVENGVIEIVDPRRAPSGTLTLRDVNLTLTPDPAPAPTDAAAADGTPSHMRTLEMTLSGDHLRHLELKGRIDPHELRFALEGAVDGLEVSPELRDALPAEWSEELAVLGALRAQATLNFRASRDSADGPVQFDLSSRLSRGRINDPRLPYPVTDMYASVHMDNAGFSVDHLFARSGQSTIRFSCRRQGYEAASPMALDAEFRHLNLNRELLDIPGVPESLRDLWYKYRPYGQLHADVKLTFDGQQWHPEATVQCLDVSLTHHKFQYRVDHGHGTVALKDNRLTVNLEAYAGSQPVRLAAEIENPLTEPVGWFEAKGDGLVLDKQLFSALDDSSQRVVSSLTPRGTINFFFRFWKEKPEELGHKYVLIGLNRCAIAYDRFPYPLSNLRGTLEGMDGRWTFRDLEGTNDTARVSGAGHLIPIGPPPDDVAAEDSDDEVPKELFLSLTATDVPLEEELRDALNPNAQRLWNQLHPRGRVDIKQIEIRYLTAEKQLGLSFRAEPRADSTSIEPVQFPYRWEKLHGALVFTNGQVRLENIRGEHGPVKLAAVGYCDFQPDASWRLVLEDLSIDRLRLDRELVKAMPERMRKGVAAFSPEGPVDLHGRWELGRGGNPDDPLRSAWDLQISFAGASVHSGIDLENLYGGLTLRGGFNGESFRSYGELAIDSATYRNLHFTQISGPLWIDDHQALFGSWADQQRYRFESRTPPGDQPAPPKRRLRPVTAKLFQGTVYANSWVALGPEPQYGLRATLADADLTQIAKETVEGRQKMAGKILATLNLRGTGRSVNALTGEGTVQLREADVYELPLMISLLKILSIKRPDSNAFGSSDIDYRVAGNHIYFDRIVFNGDAISLEGNGEMNFQGDVSMNFHPLLGREDRKIIVLRELLGGAGQEFMLIRVGGTLQVPETSKEVFPTVNQALQQLTGAPKALLQTSSAATTEVAPKVPVRRVR